MGLFLWDFLLEQKLFRKFKTLIKIAVNCLNMPLVKRILYEASVYEQAFSELYEDSPNNQMIVHKNMSKMLGLMLQISYLASYSVEVM